MDRFHEITGGYADPNGDAWSKTLLDEFAMAALTGMLADPTYNQDRMEGAKHAYQNAAAMLAEKRRIEAQAQEDQK